MIINLPDLITSLKQFQSYQHPIVLATGVFDLLHQEHLNFLTRAKSVGRTLIVGVETDLRVREMKGMSRPIEPEKIRINHVSALQSVDYVFLLPRHFSTNASWGKLLSLVKPDIYAVSSHSSYLANKQRICDLYGVKLQIVHTHNPAVSTSIILQSNKVQ